MATFLGVYLAVTTRPRIRVAKVSQFPNPFERLGNRVYRRYASSSYVQEKSRPISFANCWASGLVGVIIL